MPSKDGGVSIIHVNTHSMFVRGTDEKEIVYTL